MHPHPDTRRGVALLDVIIAALMLGIGLAVTLSTASQSLRSELTGERRLTASWLADEALALVLATGPESYLLSEPLQGRYESPFEKYDWSIEILNTGEWQPWKVRATVGWQDRGGPMSVTMETRIAPRQGDEDNPEDWKPLEPLDREARTWDEVEGTSSEGITP